MPKQKTEARTGYNEFEMLRREGEMCEECGRSRAVQWHHGLFTAKNGQTWRNSVYNLAHVCDECHGTKGGTTCRVKGWEWREKFFWRQYRRYGLPFLVWIANVPLKINNEYKELIKRAYASTETNCRDRLR